MTEAPVNPDCIFCKIVAGEIPCWKLYEDDFVIAFLDVGPLSRGHTLVIPKGHYVTLDEVPDQTVEAIAMVVKRLGAAVAGAVGCTGWNVLQNNGTAAGQVVMHVHFHIIPRSEGDELGFRWPAGELAEDDAKALIDQITEKM